MNCVRSFAILLSFFVALTASARAYTRTPKTQPTLKALSLPDFNQRIRLNVNELLAENQTKAGHWSAQDPSVTQKKDKILGVWGPGSVPYFLLHFLSGRSANNGVAPK